MTKSKLTKLYIESTNEPMLFDFFIKNKTIYIYSQVLKDFRHSFVQHMKRQRNDLDCIETARSEDGKWYVNKAFIDELLINENFRKYCYEHYIETTHDKCIQTYITFEANVIKMSKQIKLLVKLQKEN